MSLFQFTSEDEHGQPIMAAIPADRVAAVWAEGDSDVWLRDDSGEIWPVRLRTFHQVTEYINDHLRRLK